MNPAIVFYIALLTEPEVTIIAGVLLALSPRP